MSKNQANWPQKLPIIPLGLRTAYKPDIQATPAQLVYGTTIRLPGEFFHQSNKTQSQTEYAKEFENISPAQTAHHDTSKPFIFKELETMSHVFLRNDAVRTSLQPPYDGPIEVIERNRKHFTLSVAGGAVKVSVDRLKPAFVIMQQPIDKISTLEPPNKGPDPGSWRVTGNNLTFKTSVYN
ncbi:uncharacterized protein LOC123258157 [Drosophila ananassae]|uniref:uncharacterized protein LOC123258157 n=1 Tax=Drosophila ananassae TaxID=7217 RepID=UPI001CFF8797|nr:uncharacterized protein LOC123258157 [Drosophila ananassae]